MLAGNGHASGHRLSPRGNRNWLIGTCPYVGSREGAIASEVTALRSVELQLAATWRSVAVEHQPDLPSRVLYAALQPRDGGGS